MTERTGGSDVGASTTVARARRGRAVAALGRQVVLPRWPTRTLALTLARPEGAPAGTRGLAMFLVPKRLPDGSKNAWTDQPAEGQARLALDGHRRGDLRGRGRLRGGRARRGLQADDGDGERLAALERDAGGRPHAARACSSRSCTRAQRVAFGRPLVELPLLRSNLLAMLLDAEAAASVILNGAALLDRRDAGARRARARSSRVVDAARQVLDHARARATWPPRP